MSADSDSDCENTLNVAEDTIDRGCRSRKRGLKNKKLEAKKAR